MFVLGIDPGLSRCGYGVVTRRGAALSAVAGGVVSTPPGDAAPPSACGCSPRSSAALVAEYRPDAVVVERVFFQVNARTAMATGQAGGVALVAAAEAECEVAQYTANEVKQALVGYGAATKDQVQRMVASVLGLDEPPRPPDVADALALAICHLTALPLRRAVAAADRGRPVIGSLRGTLADRPATGEVLVEVGGVGYRASVPAATFAALGPTGSEVFLHVHTHVREDAIVLYGFAHADERRCFEALIGAHGVGPALALAILSSLSPAVAVRPPSSRTTSTRCAWCRGWGRRRRPGCCWSSRPGSTSRPSTGDGAPVTVGERSARGRGREPHWPSWATGPTRSAPPSTAVPDDGHGGGDGPPGPPRAGEGPVTPGGPPGGAGRPGRRSSTAVGDLDTPVVRTVDPTAAPTEELDELGLRPRTLAEFVGQRQLTEHLQIVIEAARQAAAARRPPALRRPARSRQDLAGGHRGRRDGGGPADHRRARCWSGPVTWPPSSPTSRRATSSSSTRSIASPGGRGGPLPGHGGLQARHPDRQGPDGPEHPARPAPVHPGRRHHPDGPGHRTRSGTGSASSGVSTSTRPRTSRPSCCARRASSA